MRSLGIIIGTHPKEMFLTGSSLVKDCNPNDVDYVCLFLTDEDKNRFIRKNKIVINYPEGGDEYEADRFESGRRGNINFIMTCEEEIFYRFKAFSGAISLLQYWDKKQRIELSKACLYWEDKS